MKVVGELVCTTIQRGSTTTHINHIFKEVWSIP